MVDIVRKEELTQILDSIVLSISHKHGEKPQRASNVFMLISVLLGRTTKEDLKEQTYLSRFFLMC